MKISINAHHGSPGTPIDLKNLKLNNAVLNNIDRYNNQSTKEAKIEIGYSWGCVNAIKSALLNNACEKIILIAPYLYANTTSGIKKTLISAPIISDLLLGKMGPKAIDSMLTDSSYPSTIPGQYRKDAKNYIKTDVLRKSMLEKDLSHDEINNLLEQLKKKNIPVYIVRGDKDKTSGNLQTDKIKKIISVNEVIINNAGHALLWTHTEKLNNELNKIIHNLSDNKTTKETKFGYFDGVDPRNNVASFLLDHVQKFPDRQILSWVDLQTLGSWNGDLNTELPHQSITVKELYGLVAKIGAGFKKLGIKKGDNVIIFVPMSLYLYAAMFALQKIGAAAVFMDSWARRDQLASCANTVNAKAIISLEKAFMYFNEVEEINNIPIKVAVGPTTQKYTAKLEELMQTQEMCEIEPVEKEHTALVTFTTGSSGTPKGADRTHRFLCAQHYALNRHIPYVESDNDLPVFPIFSLNNLAAGVQTIIPAIDVGTPNEKDPLVLLAQFATKNVTCTTLSPSLFNAVSAFCLKQGMKLTNLKRVVTGGAPVSNDDVKRFKEIAPNAEILVLYGSTEVEPMAHIEATEMINQKGSDDPEFVEEGVNVGKFDSGLRVKYLKILKENITVSKKEDWKNLEVEHGQVGEIIVTGEHVCRYYYNNKEAFTKTKIVDENGDIWHRTGDLGKVDNHGNLWLVGRVHNAINRNGEYFFPVRAEIILKRIDSIHRAAFLGVDDSELGEKTCAAFTLKENAKLSEDEVKAEIQRLFNKNQITADIIVKTDDIPMDPRHHSKVEYAALRDQLKEKGLL